MLFRRSTWVAAVLMSWACGGQGGDAPTSSSTETGPGEPADSSTTVGDPDPSTSTPTSAEPTTTSPPDESSTSGATETPDESSSSAATEAPDESSSDTGGPVGSCECIIVDDDESNASPSLPTCGEALCPVVQAGCDSECGPGEPFVLADPVALECALTALRDRTFGVVRWSHDENGGQYSDDGYILIREDGSAVRRSWYNEDKSCGANDAIAGSLVEAGDYDACIALVDDDEEAAFDCMRQLLAEADVTCDEGWSACG